MLGIPVPKAGLEALAMDDLVRDTARLSRGDAARADPAGETDRLGFLAERWAQMGLTVEAGGRCGVRAGTGAEVVVVETSAPTPGDAHQWAGAAAVVSLAKTVHGRPEDPRGAWFCVGPAPVTGAVTIRFGALGGADAAITDDGGAVVVADGVVGEVGDLDHRRVEAAVRLVHPRLLAALGGGG